MKFSNLKGDIFGGLTAGIVALPLALAFGVQSGLGAVAGLYGAIALGLFAALFGGTNTQISGPTGPMTVISAAVVATAISKYGSIEDSWSLIIITFVLAGVFQIIFGIIKIGTYIRFIPYPVLSGFMSAIGIIIIINQIFPIIGLVSPVGVLNIFASMPGLIPKIDWTALVLGVLVIAIIYTFPKITKLVPSTLVALAIAALLSYLMKLSIPTIGNMPSGLPAPHFNEILNISFSDLSLALLPALTLAGLGSIDSLLTSIVADNKTKSRHNSNKELVGQGIGNMIAGFFGGLPGAGATMRTVININTGGRTRLSGVIHAIFLLLVLLGLGSLVKHIPLAALAGVLITVGISILDLRGLKAIRFVPIPDTIVLFIVLVTTVFIDLLQAVGIGMVLSSLIFMKRASDQTSQSAIIRSIDAHDGELGVEEHENLDIVGYKGVYIKYPKGPIFFGVANDLIQNISKIPSDAKLVIFRMRRVPFIDQSGLFAIQDIVKQLHDKDVKVVFSMVQEEPLYIMKRSGFIPDVIPEKYSFETIQDCAVWLKAYCEENSINKISNGTSNKAPACT